MAPIAWLDGLSTPTRSSAPSLKRAGASASLELSPAKVPRRHARNRTRSSLGEADKCTKDAAPMVQNIIVECEAYGNMFLELRDGRIGVETAIQIWDGMTDPCIRERERQSLQEVLNAYPLDARAEAFLIKALAQGREPTEDTSLAALPILATSGREEVMNMDAHVNTISDMAKLCLVNPGKWYTLLVPIKTFRKVALPHATELLPERFTIKTSTLMCSIRGARIQAFCHAIGCEKYQLTLVYKPCRGKLIMCASDFNE